MTDWKSNFKAHVMRTNFLLALTRPQLEYLCATADNVVWDRFTFGCRALPYNPISVSTALLKRGLIQKHQGRLSWTGKNVYEIQAHHELTPAGTLVVELLKLTGLFIVADNAIERRGAKRKR